MAFLTLPAELQKEILSHAWPCPLLVAVMTHWARSEVLRAEKRAPDPCHCIWNLRNPFIIKFILIIGVKYVIDICQVEDDQCSAMTIPNTASRIVVAYNENGVIGIQWANEKETVKTIPGALWYKALRNDSL